MLRDVIVVGQGVAVAALRFLYTALQNDEAAVHGSKSGLSMMAKSAFIAATRYARQRFVLAKSEQVNFKAPAREGEMIELIAEIAETGENSVIVSGELWAEELLTGERRLCITASFTLKPVDEAGKPVPLKTPT